MSLALLLACAALGAAVPANAAGGTFYLATGGNDSNPGTLSRPWRTFSKAAASAPAGATIEVRAGTYAGFRVTRPSLIFRPYGDGPVVVDAGGARNAISVAGTHDVQLRGLIVTGAGEAYGSGIRVEASNRILVASADLRGNRSFGIQIERSTNVTVRNSLIRDNETGVQVSYGGSGILIADNWIRDNNRMVVNDTTPYNDRGANGIVLYRTTGPLMISGNRISGHRATSIDYGVDGGAIELYAASGMTIRWNRMWDNLNVLETGTDGAACRGLRFIRNVAVAGVADGRTAQGLILRCAEGALIAHNTFVDLTDFTYYVTESGAFSGSVGNLRILNNISSTRAKTYSMSSVPTGIVVDNNLVFNPAGASIAWIAGKGNTNSLSVLRTWTGFDVHGTASWPRFQDPAALDFRLRSTSSAIDRARRISGVNDGYDGRAPDIGRYES